MPLIRRARTIMINPKTCPEEIEIDSLPRIDHRNASIKKTKGLRLYKVAHFSGTSELLNPTGVTNSPSCNRKGMIYLRSLYFTLREANHKDGPRITKIVSK